MRAFLTRNPVPPSAGPAPVAEVLSTQTWMAIRSAGVSCALDVVGGMGVGFLSNTRLPTSARRATHAP